MEKPKQLKEKEFIAKFGKNFKQVIDEAHKAGVLAALEKVPTPMVVQQHANQLDDNSPVVKQWLVPQGVCGFAKVSIYPGNSPFANYLKKAEIAKPSSYEGGVYIWVSDYLGKELPLPDTLNFGQSMELKEAYAYAFAGVLKKYEIRAYASSRLD